MKVDQFYQSRQADWKALTELIEQGRSGVRRFSADDIDRLGRLYRAATSDLALAQRDFPTHQVTRYLNQLVGRAHAVVYQGEPLAWRRLVNFARHGFPRAYRQAFPFIAIATALFVIPALIAGVSVAWEPDAARWMLGSGYEQLISQLEEQELWTDRPVHERPGFSSYVMQNNIQVAFLAFGGGMSAGLFTVWNMVMNGLNIGALTGLTAHYGVGFDLWTFAIGHGVIELTMIFIAGGSGLMLGWAMIHPGLLSRRDALTLAARRAVRLIIGCVPMLVVAGLIEGFISPAEDILALQVDRGIGERRGALQLPAAGGPGARAAGGRY